MDSDFFTSSSGGLEKPSSSTIETEFVANESTNRFARICCKTRILTPTLCDGTCIDCKRSRDTYLMTEPIVLIKKGIMENGGDNEYTPLTLEEAKIVVQARIARIEEAKKTLFDSKKMTAEKVAHRMHELEEQSRIIGDYPSTLH